MRGGFAPNLASDEEAIEAILEAVSSAGYTTDEVKIALDAAASEWAANDGYLFTEARHKIHLRAAHRVLGKAVRKVPHLLY